VATPKQFRRRGRWSLIIGTVLAALTFGAVMAFASSSSVGGITVTWTGNGTNTDGTCQSFLNDPDLTPGPGQQGWLFILTSPATGSHELTTSFDPSFQTPSNPITGFGTGSIHFIVYTDAGAKLLSASATNGTDNSNLTVSHCVAAEKAQPKIVTKASGDAVTGATLSDTATLSDGVNLTGDGSITFQLYGPGQTCGVDTPLYTDTVTGVDHNGDYTSNNNGTPTNGNVALTTGTYQWAASFSGDDNNESIDLTGCGEDAEANVVTQSAPTVLTTIDSGQFKDEPPVVELGADPHVALGSFVHDSATVDPGSTLLPTPTGDVTFTFYTKIDCTTDDTHLSTDAGKVTLDNGVAHPSSDEGALAAGSYSFSAHYTPDAASSGIYKGGDSLCEKLTVDQGTTKSSTEIHLGKSGDETDPPGPTVVGGDTHVDLGSFAHDSASVTGSSDAFAPTGNVSFTFYTKIDCTTDDTHPSTDAGTVAFDNGVAHPSSDEGALAAGSYSFVATYAGDNNYQGSTSGCEPLTVDQTATTTVTKVKDAAGNDVTNKAVLLNSFVHDSANVGTAVDGFPITGTVTYSLFGGDCTTGTKLIPDETVAVGTDSSPYQVIATGAYAYSATYNGDSNYKGSTGVCEPFIVRTFGKTMGFWGNTNGQALLTTNNAFTTPLSDNQFAAGYAVTIGVKNGGCYIAVDSANKSKTIFPNTLNGLSILQNCMGTTYLDTGINGNSMNTLLGQTLALSYNILYKTGFAGQTIGAMGCTAVGTLTSTSTVQDARTYANYLIQNAKKSYGAVITQSQIGLMNTLLGCMNAEA
jgi:hypothetical protein